MQDAARAPVECAVLPLQAVFKTVTTRSMFLPVMPLLVRHLYLYLLQPTPDIDTFLSEARNLL